MSVQFTVSKLLSRSGCDRAYRVRFLDLLLSDTWRDG